MSVESCKNLAQPVIMIMLPISFLLGPQDPNLPSGIPKPLGRFKYKHRLNIFVGSNVTLVVNVTGNPNPKITWFKDNKLLDWSNPRFTLLTDNSLMITNARVSESGNYDYMAENDKGQIFPRLWDVLVDCKYFRSNLCSCTLEINILPS